MKMLANKVWNSSDLLRMRRGISTTPRLWIGLTLLYAVFVGALAASGQMEHPRALPTLLATALSLPFGFVALVGLYASYGFIDVAARAFGAQVGEQIRWFVVVHSLVVAVLFAAAVVGNSALLRSAVLRHQHKRARKSAHR
jgi:hypothetical protein